MPRKKSPEYRAIHVDVSVELLEQSEPFVKLLGRQTKSSGYRILMERALRSLIEDMTNAGNTAFQELEEDLNGK